jgi:citrate lyase subunit beta / citryl-CoA lyase
MSPLLRSLLFVPGDSERKQAKALASPADALILDLEDSVAEAQLPAARTRVRELLVSGEPGGASGSLGPGGSVRPQLWVRVHSLASGLFLEDLVAVFPGAPAGLVLPKVSAASEIIQVDRELAALEARDGRAVGSTQIIVIATETPQAVLSLPAFAGALLAQRTAAARVAALTWGAEDLSAAIGATGKHQSSGALTFTFQLARGLCQLAAAALGVQALDGVYVNFRDGQGLEREAAEARRDGFTGKLAIHPDQIAPINRAFTPTDSELARARRVVAAFAASPQAGVLNLDGEMIDRPHLLQARRLLQGSRQSVEIDHDNSY